MSHDLHEAEDVRSFEQPDSELPPLPIDDDDSFLQTPSESADSHIVNEESALMNQEMKRKLMDIESSFIPEPSINAEAPPPTGADDTYLFGGSTRNTRPHSQNSSHKQGPVQAHSHEHMEDPAVEDSLLLSSSPPTPSDAYKTPRPRRLDSDTQVGHDINGQSLNEGTSTSDPLPSSPAAAAADRTSSRKASNPRFAENTRADGEDGTIQIEQQHKDDDEARSEHSQRPHSSASTAKAPEFQSYEEGSSISTDHQDMSIENISVPLSSIPSTIINPNKRPSFLQNRQASQRSSLSSFTNRSDMSGDGGSDATLGADYALQSGGAAPSSMNRLSLGLSRLPSLGSIASSVSGYSDSNPSWDRTRSISGTSTIAGLPSEKNLERLDEERPGSATPPATPRASSVKPVPPTDTVIARHIQDIQVPDTVAREYREKHLRSPDKRTSMAMPFHSRNKHNLTLKEQNSKIDKLSKENFDLKLKIHFLDQALQNRSDEGVKEMISKNVQLQTDLANEKKENQSLRRKVRDLERKMKAQEDGLAAARGTTSGSEEDKSDQSSRQADMEEEITWLRERVESTETLIEKLKEENLAKEVEKRRMAEYIKSMGERNTSEPSAGVNEAMGMWKEDLDDERARREQAEAEAEKLREEVRRLKDQYQPQPTTNHNIRNVYNISKRNLTSYTTRSHSGSDVTSEQAPTASGASSTLVEQLRSENSELRRDLGAQTSMLTSRNRERERLQQEIEDLKLTARRGDGVRSVAGDSIFERSISRAHQRSASRASGATRVTQLSDPERDEWESKCAALRDEISQTKLINQDLERELNQHLNILEDTEKELEELKKDADLQTEDLQALQAERDEALDALQDKEQECEKLREEAISTIERLEDEIEQKEQERNRLLTEIDNRDEDFTALQQEMKSVSESLVQLEDDRDANLRKIQTLGQELDDANRELEGLDKRLRDALAKNERLEIQLESSQGEIAFLREEQEGDKIKIGELESTLNTARTTIQDEKERFRDLEERLAEERRQREILDSQEKEELQKVLTDLNLQASKAKEEVRRLRKNLSSKEVEATTWKQRLDELESNLREALGNLNGTRSSLLKSRRLTEVLERERQARRQDQANFENAKRGHQTVTRTVQQHETRVLELETARSQDRQKFMNLERQFKDQLLDRNNLLLALWNRLSTLCGAEWARNNSLVNGELPSLEVVSRNLPGFNKNIILAVKTVESIVGNFRQRIRMIEKELLRDYQTLEHTLDVRMKRLDQLEKTVLAQRQSIGRPSTIRGGVVETGSVHTEVSKLKNENKMLKAELQFHRQTQAQASESQAQRSPSSSSRSANRASVAATLLRHHSTSAVDALEKQDGQQYQPTVQSTPLQPSEQRWIHRLKELERRLKAEREARLLDRSGARKRLEESSAEKEELRMLLEREKERRGSVEDLNGHDHRQGD
ncbi:hypothetical protein AOQ84DRAFT_334233 [Glonium stellatum]|uniref:Anucleate primary sterigmata protein B n=1 Tax=Glonium stellatum TaxID=574774 RepID=A0A8E2F8Z3_9PEZI|nr:hypothetical protein AOQ84DRAFT_334233 [Glonium stellatum]